MTSSANVPPNQLTASSAIRAIQCGELKSRDVVEACVARISERDALVNAWTYIDGSEVLKHLYQNEDKREGSPLCGLPVGIKDVIDTVDMPTAYGSPVYKGNQTSWDAACVALLRAKGATILGKTATTEFAMREPASTRNPLSLDHSPGGSSSGSAAAVADFMTPLALGSQTTGSTIRPASYCGVYALKPSFGLINRAGLHPLSDTFDTVGIFARSIEDLQLGLAVTSGSEAVCCPGEVSDQAPKIAFCRSVHWSLVDKFVQTGIEDVAARLAACGAKIIDFELPDEFRHLDESQAIVANYEICRALSYERAVHSDLLSNTLKERMSAAEAITLDHYIAARAHLARCHKLLEELMTDYDCILSPSASGEAPRFGSTGEPVFQKIWHGLGLVAVNVPAMTGKDGLPVGIQVLGCPWSDAKTLCHSQWISSALGL